MRHRILLTAVVVALVIPFQAVAQAPSELERDLDDARGTADELSDDLERLQQDRAAAEEELAEIGARLADAQGRLDHAQGQVALAEAALLDAEEAHEAAVEDHERAEEQLKAAEEALEHEEEMLADQVVEGFKYGTVGATRGAMLLEVVRRVDDPNGFAVGMKQLRNVVDAQDETVTSVMELREERGERAEEAAASRDRASEAADDAEETLVLVEDLRAQAAELAASISQDQAQQERVVEALRTDEQETSELLDAASTRQTEIEDEIREQRRQQEQPVEPQASDPASGAPGGPAVAGGHCPVEGAVVGQDFTNDWGYPRAGGRTHQGNDLFAERGRPVVAVDDGVVVRMDADESAGGLGGITLTYETSDGSQWYNAHLDEIADGLSEGDAVSAGQQVATVGNTGNARTTPPHLHLGRRHGGGWVNPYPTISELCR